MKDYTFTYREPESKKECKNVRCDECYIIIKEQNLSKCFNHKKLSKWLYGSGKL